MRRILAAKIMLAALLLFPGQAISAGIPVFDGASVTQATISAFESVNQTLTQLQQYATQLQQLEDQIRNSLGPATYLWSEVERTIGKIQSLQSQVMAIYGSVNNLDSYLENYKDLNYYRSLLNNPGATREQLMASELKSMETRRVENEEILRSFKERQEQLKSDSSRLDQLSRMTGSAQGRMEALQYANQYASLQNSQLLQLRSLLETMAQASLKKEMAEQDLAARRKAADEAASAGTFEKVRSPGLPRF